MKSIDPTSPSSPLHTLLSMFIPGLGQIVSRYWGRGLSIFLSTLILGSLSAWTAAQRARYPSDVMGSAFKVFGLVVLQAVLLLLFLFALQRLAGRTIIKDPAAQSFAGIAVGILYFIAVVLLTTPFLELAGSLAGASADLKFLHGATLVMAAGSLAAFWVWQAVDAGRIARQPRQVDLPSMITGVLLLCLVIFFLGYRITGIDLPKAISQYKDTNILFSRIAWPWRNAFEFDVEAIESQQKIQSPCPEGATGPASNEPLGEGAWVSVTPTCGDLTERDLRGTVTLGTLLTITGGGFTPGQTVEIMWKNPIGNAFKPRGVGETDILIDENGEFETQMYVPEVVIASTTAMGDQIHTLIVREETEEVFTGRLSREMNLALVGILETIMIGLVATFFGVILAFPVAFLAARNLMAPIIYPLGEVVGKVLGAAVGLWLAFYASSALADAVGGLDKAPLLVFPVLLVLVVVLGGGGFQMVGNLYKRITEKSSEGFSRIFFALQLGILAALPGYVLGRGFSSGIVSIPQGAEKAALTENWYALGGAVLLAVAGLVQGWRIRPKGEVKFGLIVYGATRTVMNIIRSIEPIIWAIIAAIWVGLGPFAGTIALTLHTVAALGKLYSESIESIEHGPIEALQATGATRLQTIVYAVIPQILPPFISFTIYRWDINVRMSTVIGLVGGGGIGFILIQWIRQFQYVNAGLAVWLIAITVSILDFVSSNIRERYI